MRIKDIKIGDKINRLTILSWAGCNPAKEKLVECLCDCGKKKIIRAKHIIRAISPTRSCGCLQVENGGRNKLIDRTNIIYTKAWNIYKNYNITKEEMIAYMNQPCFYCNDFFVRSHKDLANNNQVEAPLNGIDHFFAFDSNYPNNINTYVSACAICNWAKRGMDGGSYITHCSKVNKYQQLKYLAQIIIEAGNK